MATSVPAKTPLVLDGCSLSVESLVAVGEGRHTISISADAMAAVLAARKVIDDKMAAVSIVASLWCLVFLFVFFV